MGDDEAQSVAVDVLSFLAEEESRITGFLASAGIDAAGLRAAAGEPGFLSGVLGHLLADDALLLSYAEWSGTPPDTPARAHAAISGTSVWDST